MKVRSLLVTVLLGCMVSQTLEGYLFVSPILIVTCVSPRSLAGQPGVTRSSMSPQIFGFSREMQDDGRIRSPGMPVISFLELGDRSAKEVLQDPGAGPWGAAYGDLTAQHAGGHKSTASVDSTDMGERAFTQLAVSSESGSSKSTGDERSHNGDESDAGEGQDLVGGRNNSSDAKNDGDENKSFNRSGGTSRKHVLSTEHHGNIAGSSDGKHVQWYSVRTNFPPRLLRLLAKSNETSTGQKWYTILTNFKPHILKLTPEQ